MTAEHLLIPYQTENFPPGVTRNGSSELPVTWDDLLWAAVTVGRPNRQYAFRHGTASLYEALLRWSILRMALKQVSTRGRRLRRTNALNTLDPTEKGMVNYFLGMTFCKLFADKLLGTPWVLHLDVFRPALDPELKGRSRPDLVGQETGTTRWHAFECKGRIGTPDSTTKQRAKDQALRLVSVKQTPCTLHVGAVTYFRGDVLQFYWRDPEPETDTPITIPFVADAWEHYYAPVVDLISIQEFRLETKSPERPVVPIEGLDLEIGIHEAVAPLLARREWANARQTAVEAAADLREAGFQPDGLMIRAGETWRAKFDDSIYGDV